MVAMLPATATHSSTICASVTPLCLSRRLSFSCGVGRELQGGGGGVQAFAERGSEPRHPAREEASGVAPRTAAAHGERATQPLARADRGAIGLVCPDADAPRRRRTWSAAMACGGQAIRSLASTCVGVRVPEEKRKGRSGVAWRHPGEDERVSVRAARSYRRLS